MDGNAVNGPMHEAEARQEGLLTQLDGQRQKVTIRELALESIERDPNQPRQHIDPAKLKSLADSMARDGLLQEPAVYPIEMDSTGVATRFRLIYGERRWLAAKLLGWQVIPCKVVARGDQGTIDDLKLMDRQWSENAERDGLSAVEEGKAIAAKVKLLRAEEPDTPVGSLIERVAVERDIHPLTGRNLVALLDAPESLQNALLTRKLERTVAFVLMRHWNKLRKQADVEHESKRQIRYRNLVKEWAAAQGIAFDGGAIAKYAAATAQDVKIARATCRVAEKVESELEEKFASIVAKAIEKRWTVEEASSRLGRKDSAASLEPTDAGKPVPVYEQLGPKGRVRLVIHVDRIRGGGARPAEIDGLASTLRRLLAELETWMAKVAGEPDVEGPSATKAGAERQTSSEP